MHKGKLAPLLLLASLAAAQTSTTKPAEIQNWNVLRNGSELKIEITLSQPVKPSVILATHPDRIVVDLPNTSSDARQERRNVHEGDVRTVRLGLNSSDPLISRMVVDLDQARPYGIDTSGNKITLTVLLADQSAGSGKRKGAAVPAASGPLLGRLHRDPQPSVSYGEITVSVAPVTPPPALPPLKLPETHANAASGNSSSSDARPSAAHPNYASLQQGTVFPNAGAPGTGAVPPVNNGDTSVGQWNPAKAGSNNPQPTQTSATGGAFSSANTAGTPSSKQAPPSTSAPSATSNPSVTSANAVTSSPALATQAAATGSTQTVVTQQTSAPANTGIAPSSRPPQIAQETTSGVSATGTLPSSSAAPSAAPSAARIASGTAVADSGTGKSSTIGSTAPATTAVTSAASSPAISATAAAAATSGPTTTGETSAPPNASAETNLPSLAARQPNSDIRMSFRVKYVAEGAAYLEGGRSSGLSEGMKLEIRDITGPPEQNLSAAQNAPVIAELEVTSVAETSAVTDIHLPKRDVKPGDYAFLSGEDTETLVAQRSLSATRKYPTVISFTDGDPLDEEAREEVPRPPLPEINRARGRFGFDYSSVVSHGAFSSHSSSTGIIVRTDITRIGGTYWNLNGYWRGRLTSSSASGQQTLQDLINRTYTLGLTYDNPKSAWVAGFGRLYLPYATSLDTIDGGYFGRRVSSTATVGVFAGSTPDPSSWSYNPNQEIGGTFVNFQGGSFDALRYSSTSGAGVNMLHWKINRPFVFFENGIYYKRLFSLYSAVQADRPAGNVAVASPGPGLSRSFTTLRIQPIERLEFDVNHTYFRDLPTFDPTLIGTGLLDKFLFQGFSFGPRVEVIKDIWVYSSFGRSSRTGDAKASWNQMYGVTFGHVPWTRVRADVHYSKFDSSFGSGKYTAMSLSRSFKDTFRWEVLGGIQSYASAVAASNKSHFVTGTLEAPLGAHFFLQSGYTWNRGGTQDYDQYLFSVGYRFDTKYKSIPR